MKKRYRLTTLSKILIVTLIGIVILTILNNLVPKDTELDRCISNNLGHKQTPEAAEAWCIRNINK